MEPMPQIKARTRTTNPTRTTRRAPRTFRAFAHQVEQLLGGAAGKKGYNVGGADAKNPLYEFVLGTTGDHGHAMGECIYKIVRYQKRRNPEDVLKAAAWLFLIYRYHQERR
jgi:hypothetical protein